MLLLSFNSATLLSSGLMARIVHQASAARHDTAHRTSPCRAFRIPLQHSLAAALSLVAGPANAADKVTFLTSWYAQAEHGGFYQAKATGLYDKAGLDVTIKMGGPQVNGMQLLLGGDADIMMGYDFQVLIGVAKGLPVITIGSVLPEGPAGHDDARRRQGSRRPERQDHPRSRPRGARRGGRGSSTNSATPMRRRSPTPSTCSRSSPTTTSPSNPIRRPSRFRPCRSTCR